MSAVVHLHLQALAVNKAGLIAISLNGDDWFRVPDELQDTAKHTELMKISKVNSNASAVGQPPFKKEKPKYRRIRVELSAAVKPLYLDELDDFKIGNEYLDPVTEELRHDKKLSSSTGGVPKPLDPGDGEVSQLLRLLLEQKTEGERKRAEEQTERQNEKEYCKLRDLKSLFMIAEYDGKANADQWMIQFEKECGRLEVPSSLYVEALRMFIGKNLADWYEANAIKLNDREWTDWRKAFVETYTPKGWSDVRSALKFKHLGGSMIDYANTKERKLLEVDQTMPEKFRVYQIVCGLPTEVQARIDRETETFAGLIAKLRELNDAYDRKKCDDRTFKENKLDISRSVADKLFAEKKPCPFCEAIGFRNNFHPLESCRNKQRYDQNIGRRQPKRDGREVNFHFVRENDRADTEDYSSAADDEDDGDDQSDLSSQSSTDSRSRRRSRRSKTAKSEN